MAKNPSIEKAVLPFWQRLLLTTGGMLLISFLAGWLWGYLFGFIMPSYVSGIIGGLTALPLWEFLKRVRPKNA